MLVFLSLVSILWGYGVLYVVMVVVVALYVIMAYKRPTAGG